MDLDRLRLARTEGVGPITYRRLMARYGSAAEAIEALPQLAAAGGRAVPPRVPTRSQAAREVALAGKLGATMVFLGDAAYPPALAATDGAPSVLTVMGDVACLSIRSVALVGSRNASVNGRRMAEAIAEDLAAAGIVVVSGLARGVDAAAHKGALRAGRTVACIAGGIDVPYPREHAELQAQIGGQGAVVAESPLGAEPQARHFPRRNRVIAGLSVGVVVVEAALRSGSLITARLAGEFGRDVFAVPGSPMDERARGTNGLIRDGALLVENAADVLSALSPGLPPPLPAPQAGFAEDQMRRPTEASIGVSDRQEIITLLSAAPTDVDDLIRRCHLPAPAVLSVLLDLEIAGRIETLPGGRVAWLG